ncbi:peptide-methionine (S)-S-oxide reductase MsrA [uncultured Dokdonia sp.]|uniref:peptide-methionine (S)-S-oxide reductase MsrA n=1 Tax=uncultured Dokdonia sp. TaxID=575653 RepID=UPI002626D8D4|nr:peptide-methionine (S)-S-oxide reductase MsrA [uncultured Dokdonia sp.]
MNNLINDTKFLTLGGGCFWCTEAIFQEVNGVVNVTSGYSGGTTDDCPSYQTICKGMTGHAEVIQIEYEPEIVSLEELLIIFMTTHNPTSLNQQGADKGTQYRSIIFYETQREKVIIDTVIKELQPYFEKAIVTEIKPFNRFFKAEDRHQQYYQLNKQFGYCTAIIEPKLVKFRKQYAEKLKKSASTTL